MSSSSPSSPLSALILVGGYGTRLRPFTFSVCKPLVEFCSLPILEHQIRALVSVGVKKIILAVNVEPDEMQRWMDKKSSEYGITMVCSREDTPMGTAGPIALAKDHLKGAPFFMLNSDVICEFPFAEMVRFHHHHKGTGTLFVTRVSDPSKYGVVVSEPSTGKISQFIEKPPPPYPSDEINAGIYLLDSSVIDMIPLKPTSIEREIFPVIASRGQLFKYNLQGFWMDIGQPKDFVTGQQMFLQYMQQMQKTYSSTSNPPSDTYTKLLLRDFPLSAGSNIVGNVFIHKDAKVDPDTKIGPDVVISAGCVIEKGARIKRSCIMSGVKVHSHSLISGSIIGWKSSIHPHSHVIDSFLGEDVQVSAELVVKEAVVCPHKGVGESVWSSKIIM